jgi:polysaccharide export outer membrane protein
MVVVGRLWLLIFAAFLSGCMSSPPLGIELPAAPAYKVGPGDRLNITVFGEATLSREYAVTSAGAISFPLIGDLSVSGLTIAQLSDALVKKLGAGYMKDPRVTVEVVNYRPFFILGEVMRAGSYPYVTDLSVLQAVAMAGGYTYRANKSRVFIRRAGETMERTYVLTPDNPVWLLPGDTIRIGERYF